MKKTILFAALPLLLALTMLSGCKIKLPFIASDKEFKSVEHTGEVPEEFKKIVEENLFYDVKISKGRILKVEVTDLNKAEHTYKIKVSMLDKYAKTLSSYEYESDDAYYVRTMTVTEDGGFIFVDGFTDYAYDKDTWASDKGFASRVIKCDGNGNVVFDTRLEQVSASALRFCYEENGRYYLFGSLEAPETKQRGVYSCTDVYAVILDKNGEILKTRRIAGSDFDDLDFAEPTEDGFLLSVKSQSDDGDFEGSGSGGYYVDWTIKIDCELQTTEMKKQKGRDYFDAVIGETDGKPIHRYDPIIEEICEYDDVNSPTAVIDYGDFYLLVYENVTGQYEKQPVTISSIWCYTETVYSAYDKTGKLLWRTAVDSSPDYDEIIEGRQG